MLDSPLSEQLVEQVSSGGKTLLNSLKPFLFFFVFFFVCEIVMIHKEQLFDMILLLAGHVI